jgi:translocation and assembly module TamB
MKARRIKKIIFYFFAALILLLATLVALIETQAGSRFLVKSIATHFGVELGEVSGNLRKGLDIDWVRYQKDQQNVAATNISFRWNATALLYNTVSIESLSLDSLKIVLPESQKKSNSVFSQWPDLRLPMRVGLRKFRLKNIDYTQGTYHDQWQRLSGSINLGTFHLRYAPLILVNQHYHLRLSGKSDLQFPYVTDANLTWKFTADTRYQGKTVLTGSLQQLLTQTEIALPLKAHADIRLPLVNEKKELLAQPNLSLDVKVEKQYLPQIWWVADKALPLLDLHLQAKGNWHDYSGHLSGNLVLEGLPALDLSLKAQGNLNQLSIEQLQLIEAREVSDKPLSSLLLNGMVKWSPELKWDLLAKTEEFDAALLVENWPTRINASFHSDGEKKKDYWLWKIDDLNVEGSVRDLAFSLKGNLHQNQNELRSQGLQLLWGANRIDVNGYLAKESKVVWNIQAPMLNQIDDQLGGSLISKGNISGSWSLPQISLEAKGEDLSWNRYALKKLQINFSPALTAADNKSIKEFSLLNNASQMNTGHVLLNQNYALQFVATQLQINQDLFKTINLTGEGSLFKHQLNASIRHNRFGKLEFDLSGQLQEKEWHGKLKTLSLKIKNVPKWWLSSSQSLVINEHQVDIKPLCFTTRSNQTAIIDQSTQVAEDAPANTPFYLQASPVQRKKLFFEISEQHPRSDIQVLHAPELCLDANWQKQSGLSLNVDVNAVPLRQFYALFKPEVFFAGVMDGYLHLQSTGLDLASTRAFMNLETRNAELRYQYEGGLTEVYPWEYASLSAQMLKSQLTSQLKMDWTGFGNINTEIDLALDQKLINSSHFQAAFHNLEPLETLLPFTDNVKGQFNADLNLQGTFDQPQVSGALRLQDASARIPKLGLSLEKLGIEISADNSNQINLMAAATSGKGHLQLQGALMNPLQENWQVNADLSGKDFQIINLLTMKANINPTFNLSANTQLIKLSGEAEVPQMRADIKTLPQSAVQVSEDVIIVDGKMDVNQSKTIPLQVNLRLRLGDDVKFTGFGLDSQLSGDVKLIKEPQRSWITNGYVAVKEGSYQAYGQALSIERGRLIFQGDYENPGLDIHAYRNIDDEENTKVVLEISGSLQRPKSKVRAISDDPISDSDAMMMLLTGKPLSEASKGDASMLIAALGGMGVERSQGITQEVAQFFGVDEVSIKSEKGIDQSQLWVGKYVTPKILVRYVVGLFDQAFSLGVVYRLTDRVRVEAESGETQSFDVIYKIER